MLYELIGDPGFLRMESELIGRIDSLGMDALTIGTKEEFIISAYSGNDLAGYFYGWLEQEVPDLLKAAKTYSSYAETSVAFRRQDVFSHLLPYATREFTKRKARHVTSFIDTGKNLVPLYLSLGYQPVFCEDIKYYVKDY